MENMQFFATAAKETESLVVQELAAISAQNIRPTIGGVHFEGDWRRFIGRTFGFAPRTGF